MGNVDELQNYLFEVCVYRIKFNPNSLKLPEKKKMDVFVTFKDLINTHITGDVDLIAVPAPGGTDDLGLKKFVMNLNYWKSQEFSVKPEKLSKLLAQAPLELWFSTDRDPMSLGKVRMQWPLKVFEFVNNSKETMNLPPISFKGAYELCAKDTTKIIGEVDVSVTLSCPFIDNIL